MKAFDKVHGVLCLIGADDIPSLALELQRIKLFLNKSGDVPLIDVVFTATVAARGRACVMGIWVASLDELKVRIRAALRNIAAGRTKLRDKSGIYFTGTPLVAQGGKVAFIYPGTGSFHLEMMRDLAITFTGVREMFDDMEEAFSGFCNVASPSEWLFATSPEHTMHEEAHAATFMPLLAVASTYLASCVFTNILNIAGIKPQAVAGIGLGAFTAYRGACSDPKSKLVQLLRDSGKVLLRLINESTPLVMLSISKVDVDIIKGHCAPMLDDATVIEVLSHEDCVICVTSARQMEFEQFILAAGGEVSSESMVSPFNTGYGSLKMRQLFVKFFTQWTKYEPDIPFYSCVTGTHIGTSTSSVISALVEQMMEPIDLVKTLDTLYDDGFRVFVEVGARGVLSPMMEKVLKRKAEATCVVPMHILQRTGGMQVGQALGILAAQGVQMDLSTLNFFKYAKWVDFNKPIPMTQNQSFYIPLAYALPGIRPSMIDPRILRDGHVNDTYTLGSSSEPSPSRRAGAFMRGIDFPLLRYAMILEEEEDQLTLRTELKLEDFPYMADATIGTRHVSHFDPSLHGLTLFSISSGLEIMAETARKRYPNLRVAKIKNIRALCWLSFKYNKVTLKISVERLSSLEDKNIVVKVQLRNDAPSAEFTSPLIEAHFYLVSELSMLEESTELPPLIAPRLVDWKSEDIYPKRLLQGTLLRNVLHVSSWSMNGIDYEVQVPWQNKTVKYVRKPLFSVMPLLLDAVVFGFTLWRSHERFHGAISLPFRCRSIHYSEQWLAEGTPLKASLRLVNVTPRSHQVDIRVTDASGRLVMMVNGWEEVSDRVEKTLHDFVAAPLESFLTRPLPEGILPDDQQGVVGAIYENTTSDFFVHNQELWLKALAETTLSPTERSDFNERIGSPFRRLEWLLGRIAAKESVRRYLGQHQIAAASVDVDVWKDDLGKPHPLGPWSKQLSGDLDLTIAHTEGLIIAAVAPHGKLGLDIEGLGRDLTEDFLRGVFTLEEQELASKSGYGPDAVLRFWCAKEAISKALGTGIRFAPTDLRIRQSQIADGMLKIELLGQWVIQFPRYKGKLIDIKTGVVAGHAVAACILPSEDF